MTQGEMFSDLALEQQYDNMIKELGMKQTAVQFFWDKIALKVSFEQVNEFMGIFEQAKEMEKQQAHEYAEFAIICDRKDMKILEFDGYINLETFKSE